jgi:hypothetical protein
VVRFCARRKYIFDAICDFIITLQFRCYAHLFFLSLRTTIPPDAECPVDIKSLCNLHNIIGAHRLNPKAYEKGLNTEFKKQVEEKAFGKQIENWNQYQKKYNSRLEFMKRTLRIDPVHQGNELVALSSKDALIGTLPDLSLGTKSDKCSSITCALLPERDVEGPPLQFHELYYKRNVAYKNSNLSKMTSDQMANLQLLVRMDIQYLSSVDVEWQEGGVASPEASHVESSGKSADGSGTVAVAAAAAAAGAGGGGVGGGGGGGGGSGGRTDQLILSIHAAPQSKNAAAGTIARNEDYLIRFALRKSKQDLSISRNVEYRGDACCTRADPSLPASSKEVFDFSDIVNWDHRRGWFPLTPEALPQMKFDHTEHTVAPKYVFPAAILLFFRTERNGEEEAAYQSLSDEWDFWFDYPLSYEFLKNDPPKRLGLNAEEINWCKVRLEALVQDIKSPSARERLGLPPFKPPRPNRASEAALLLNASKNSEGKGAAQSNHGSTEVRDEAVDSEKAAVDPAPRAAAAVVSESAGGSGGIADKEGGGKESGATGKVEKRVRKKRQAHFTQPDVEAAAAAAPAAKRGKLATEGGSPASVKDEEKTTVRASDGKTVSVKDGRIVAAGHPLKTQYPNHYRNPDNQHDFHGRNLTLGEAFKLACLVQYGPSLPIETSGHLSMRTALFRTAAYYALSDEEEKTILGHATFAEFSFFLVKSAKQLVYGLCGSARLIFGDAVFSRHPPTQKLRGTPCIFSVHYAETVFSNPLFSMQSIWAWPPRQPSWLARTGGGQGSYRSNADIRHSAPYQRLPKRGAPPKPKRRLASRPRVLHFPPKRNLLSFTSTTANFTRWSLICGVSMERIHPTLEGERVWIRLRLTELANGQPTEAGRRCLDFGRTMPGSTCWVWHFPMHLGQFLRLRTREVCGGS